MRVKIEKLSLVELRDLEQRIAAAKDTIKRREADALRKDIEALAAKRGLKVKDVLVPKRQRTSTPWKDKKSGVVWRGVGKYPQGFERSRAERL